VCTICKMYPLEILHQYKNGRRDFRGIVVRDGDFGEANLAGAQFHQADLTGCDFRFAHLSGAVFEAAVLAKANLSGANLAHASLHRAVLAEALLTEVKLTHADLREVDLRDADLSGAHATDANFVLVDCSGAPAAHALYDRLLRAGIRVRRFVNPRLCGRGRGTNLRPGSRCRARSAWP